MVLHWNINGMIEISGRVFPGLPERGDHLLQWCGIGASALIAGLTVPSLLIAGRTRTARASAETLDRRSLAPRA
jgi:hypothetical protein